MYFDDFNVDDTFELESISIDRQKMTEFAHDYDPQKIHTDEEHGRDSRFGDRGDTEQETGVAAASVQVVRSEAENRRSRI